MLEVRDLVVRYGKARALAGVSLDVSRGSIVSVIGPNGAGKSTLLNSIMGILPPMAGVEGGLRFDNEDLLVRDTAERVAKGISLVPEKRELFGAMTVHENLILGAVPRRAAGERHWTDQLDSVLQLFPRLRERSGQLASTLSGGERQMLALGRALMRKPALLMLDEPSLGLAPLVCREIFAVIASLRGAGVSVLLIEQNARAALQISDRALVLESGAVTLEGPAAEVARDERVVQAYLGVGRSQKVAA